MKLPSLPKNFPTVMLVSLLVNGALLGQGGWTDDGSVVRLTTSTDKVGIGTTNPGSYKLAVNGDIRAKEIVVEIGWSDLASAMTTA